MRATSAGTIRCRSMLPTLAVRGQSITLHRSLFRRLAGRSPMITLLHPDACECTANVEVIHARNDPGGECPEPPGAASECNPQALVLLAGRRLAARERPRAIRELEHQHAVVLARRSLLAGALGRAKRDGGRGVGQVGCGVWGCNGSSACGSGFAHGTTPRRPKTIANPSRSFRRRRSTCLRLLRLQYFRCAFALTQ